MQHLKLDNKKDKENTKNILLSINLTKFSITLTKIYNSNINQ